MLIVAAMNSELVEEIFAVFILQSEESTIQSVNGGF